MVSAFPVKVEEYNNNDWLDYGWDCPRINNEVQIKLKRGVNNDYYCVTIREKSNLAIEAHLAPRINPEKGLLRIMFYTGEKNTPVYSNEFTAKPEIGCLSGEIITTCKTGPCCCPINAKCD